MASHSELSSDWDTLFRQDDITKWSQNDLQLAAELGKTLLERNKELEILLKEHKANSEEHEREIVYLRKQFNAMSEVNDSRLKVYEQLEVGIQDLERTNHRLTIEKTRDKKQIKSLSSNVETLESRCEEITKQLEEARQALVLERRKVKRQAEEDSSTLQNKATKVIDQANETNATSGSSNYSMDFYPENKANSTGLSDSLLQNDQSSGGNRWSVADEVAQRRSTGDAADGVGGFVDGVAEDNEEVLRLISELEATKRAYMKEQQRCSELEEELMAIINENQLLQSRQTSSKEEMMSMQDEFSLLDDVRQGQMCSRCLGAIDDRATNTINDEQSSVAPTEEADEDDEERLLRDADLGSELSSQAGVFRGGSSAKMGLDLNLAANPNPYRDLVEKYEALLEMQRCSTARKNNFASAETDLGSELNQNLMFQAAAAVASAQAKKEADAVTAAATAATAATEQREETKATPAPAATTALAKGARGRTPTEFSEAETSSSGFSDEISNKFTQTQDRPGFFLCSIGDGVDCKFSIYDDLRPVDSHFRNRPEYRELFKEIFAVLKKAADKKEEGDKLPLLDDEEEEVPIPVAKVPPVTPANEDPHLDFGDDTQSIISSAVSEQSFAMSECITKMERKTAKKHINESRNQENLPPMAASASIAQLSAATSAAVAVAKGSPRVKQIIENGRVLTPFKREPLDFLSVTVGLKKKNRRKNRGLNGSCDRGESPLASPAPSTPTRRDQGQPSSSSSGGGSRRRARKDFVPISADILSPEVSRLGRAARRGAGSAYTNSDWNGSPIIISNRNMIAERAISRHTIEVNGVEYRPTVSQEFLKLKKLDLSYAEVLRQADACEHHHQRGGQRQQRRRNGTNVSNSHHRHH